MEDQIIKYMNEASTHNNDYEKTISLQLISIATFIITLIGAFISLDDSDTLNSGIKTAVVIDLFILFGSIIFGVIHLLIVRNMFTDQYKSLSKALKLFRKNPTLDGESLEILTPNTSTTMTFLYLQTTCLTLALAVFIGLIVYILFI